jgi:SAM-dependent methyltransferase
MQEENLLLYWWKAYEELFQYIESYFYAHQDPQFSATGSWGSMSFGLCPTEAEAQVKIEEIVAKYKAIATEIDMRLSALAVGCGTRVEETLQQWLREQEDDPHLDSFLKNDLERGINDLIEQNKQRLLGAAIGIKGKVTTVEEAETQFNAVCENTVNQALSSAEGLLQALQGGLNESSGTTPTHLDLGCGENKPPGFFGIDIKPGPGVDLVHDITTGLPFPDNSIERVRAHHFLEHVPQDKVIFVMEEIWRVLKPGGVLEFEVPSTDGRNAWMMPDHKSYWNILSLYNFCDDKFIGLSGFKGKFGIEYVENVADPESGAAWVRGELFAIKDEPKSAQEL